MSLQHAITIEQFEAMHFGDLPGHEFHGNQWTGDGRSIGDKNAVANPLYSAQAEKFGQGKSFSRVDFERLPTSSVPLAGLVSGQKAVSESKVARIASNFDKGAANDIYVIHSAGQRILWSGNHTVLAAMRAGISTLPGKVLEIAAVKFGDLPGHEFHGNQWTGGFGTAPVTGTGAKAWIKANQERYSKDPAFRAAVDGFTLFTQGEYNAVRAMTEKAATGELPAPYKDTHIDKNSDQPIYGSPMATYKNYFQGQDLNNYNDPARASWNETGRAINDAIASAPPLSGPIYRGVYGNEAVSALKALKTGDTLDIKGATSFTASEELGARFARSDVSGQRSGLNFYAPVAIIKVEPGAHGVNVAALSPWKQQEVVTSGQFKVKSVDTKEVFRYEKAHPGGQLARNETTVVLEQVKTWANK